MLINQPDNYEHLIGEWSDKLSIVSLGNADNIDFIHFFTMEMAELEVTFPILKQKLRKGGKLWISWPKGISALPKDLNGNDVRRIGLEGGLVDTKVCAVNADWSGLMFMYRKKDR